MDTVREVALDIAQELKQHPERWCKGYTFYGEPEAHCIMGHVYKRVPLRNHPNPSLTGMLRKALYDEIKKQHVESWNDAPERTVQDVIDVCERIAQHDQV